ncbi:GNAT family N-acetyltransferase [Microbacterium paraoxydans]|uniref:GNAT family N-acetyltransferase n=1 Tax=Microbacterium paraoxydans TaxID=199592 RepID=UPI003D754F2F
MNDDTEVDVRLARREDLATCAETLAAAFRDYPWTRHVIPEDDYDARLAALQRLYLGYAHDQGIVAVAGEGAGTIALLRPDAAEPEAAFIAQVVALHGDRLDRVDQTPSPAGAWRLETLGVHPGRQGRGIASHLLHFALDEVARRGGGPVVLDTSDARNVRLYGRHGFRTTALTDADGAPPVWRMAAVVPTEDAREE